MRNKGSIFDSSIGAEGKKQNKNHRTRDIEYILQRNIEFIASVTIEESQPLSISYVHFPMKITLVLVGLPPRENT